MGSEWKETTIADLVNSGNASLQTGPFGTALKAGEYTTEGVPLISVREIRHGYFELTEHTPFVGKKTLARLPKFILRQGDIVFGRKGAVDRNAMVQENQDGWFLGSDGIRLRLDDCCDHRFISYQVRSRTVQNWLMQHAEGTTMLSMNQKVLGRIPLILPPKSEQKAIAHILGSLDDKIELNRRMNATLEGMAQALFKSWFVDFDPVIDNAIKAGNPIPEELTQRAEVRRQALANGTANREAAGQFPAAFQFAEELGWIPEGWEVKNLGDVSICKDRKRIPLSKKQREEKKPGHIPYYGATSIMDYINEWLFDDTYLLVGEDGSVLKEDGSPFIQYIWGKSWVNNHAHVLQGTSGVSTEHLMLFMISQNITAHVTGAVQLKLNQKNMNSIPFLKAGERVNQHFAGYISKLYEGVKMRTEENRSLSYLRDTLLPKLISGELRVPDAEKLADKALE